jgi:hypothetical protein
MYEEIAALRRLKGWRAVCETASILLQGWMLVAVCLGRRYTVQCRQFSCLERTGLV